MSDVGEPSRPAKRARLNASEYPYRRKRASTACRFCRLRKAKCDNARPRCGFCRHHQAICTYTEDETAESSDHGEPESRDIVSHLEEIKSMLRILKPPLAAPYLSQDDREVGYEARQDLPVDRLSTADPQGIQHAARPEQESNRQQLEALNTRCETVLQWPMIQALLPMQVSDINFLLFDTPEELQRALSLTPIAPVQNIVTTAGIREDQFLPLCQRFLKFVHARNPILDPASLLRNATRVAEDGLGWDAASCLVLTACALACYTTAWPSPDTATPASTSTLEGVTDQARAQGDSYYTAARRRIGLLGSSIADIQCFFLATIFEKMLLRPLHAWFNVQQGYQRLQVFLRQKATKQPSNVDSYSDHHHSSQRLEQRLFWSYYKAEQELVTELGLQPSGIDKLHYTHLLPDPPVSSPVSMQASPSSMREAHGFTCPTPQERHPEMDELHQEQSWSFYLTEISMRRTMIQSLRPLYAGHPRDWLAQPEQILNHIDSILREINVWYRHLPPIVRFSENINSNIHSEDELTSYTRGRFTEWREACLRPAMYLALHQGPLDLDLDTPTYQRLHHHAQSCIDLCAALVRGSPSTHRHGGTWFVVRNTFRAALQIAAAARHNNLCDSQRHPTQTSSFRAHRRRRLTIPADEAELYDSALNTLRKWSAEAEDVKVMEKMLEAALATLQHERR